MTRTALLLLNHVLPSLSSLCGGRGGGGFDHFLLFLPLPFFLFWMWPSRGSPQPDWVSVQAASFLHTERIRRGWAEPQKGQLPSLFRILISFLSLSLFFLPLPSASRGAEEKESQSKVHRVRLRMYNSPNGLRDTVWFDARHGLRVPSGPSVPYRRSCLSPATHCGVMRSWTSRCVLQCFYFYFLGERGGGVGVAYIFTAARKKLPLGVIYIYLYIRVIGHSRQAAAAAAADTKYCTSHVCGVHESHFYFPQRKKKTDVWFLFFLAWLHLKPFYEKL